MNSERRRQVEVSIEVPVFKGRFLRECIDSVLAQTSDAWSLSLVWDGGDQQSRQILEQQQERGHPRVHIHFTDNRGIAPARRFLTAHSHEPYILPLDDDDLLAPHAVERFSRAAREWPWASLIRARRQFVDEQGAVVAQAPWFPFGPRRYQQGMVSDVFNQAQPYLIRRSAYDRTGGWRGFSELLGAGEDCDLFLQLEEVAHFELIDEVLYSYRLHERRASHSLTPPAAFEMWRRLADQAITRMGLPLLRASDAPPFVYRRRARPAAALDDIDFVLGAPASEAAAALEQCGVAPDALVRAAPGTAPSHWKMAGFRATKRPLVCYLNEGACIRERTALERLVRALDEQDADLLAPARAAGHGTRPAPRELPWRLGPCLLLRRELIAATGGFDEQHVALSLQDVDLCLQALRRGFHCALVESTAWSRSPEPAWTEADVRQLRAKWQSHPALLASES